MPPRGRRAATSRADLQQVQRYHELQRAAGRSPSPMRSLTPPRARLIRKVVITEDVEHDVNPPHRDYSRVTTKEIYEYL